MAEYFFIDSNRVILKVIPVTKTARIVFSCLIGVGFILPIGVVGFVVSLGDHIPATVLLSFVLFWGASFLLFRMLSWNTSGQETLTIDNGKVTLKTTSKRFIYNEKSIHAEHPVFGAIPTRLRWIGEKELQTGKLMVANMNQMEDSLISDVELPMDELIYLLETLNSQSDLNS